MVDINLVTLDLTYAMSVEQAAEKNSSGWASVHCDWGLCLPLPMQCRHERAHWRTSTMMLGQTYFRVLSRCVALMPGCDRKCRLSKTSRRNLGAHMAWGTQ